MQDDDVHLVPLASAGDRPALTLLYERYRGPLFAFCLRILTDASLAEDAVQETFLKLRSEGLGITKPGALKQWLYKVARNEALGMIRRRRNGTQVDPDSVWDEETPQSELERKDEGAVVRAIIGELKPEYREVIILREYDGLSYAEIAAVTGDSESSVKSRLFKARKALAERLAPLWKERVE